MKNPMEHYQSRITRKKIHQKIARLLGWICGSSFSTTSFDLQGYTPLGKMNTFFEAKAGNWMEDVVTVFFFNLGVIFSASFAVSF